MACDSVTVYWILWGVSNTVAFGPIILGLFSDAVAQRLQINIGMKTIRWVLVLAGLINLLATLRLLSMTPCL
jgi:hypothetical protein